MIGTANFVPNRYEGLEIIANETGILKQYMCQFKFPITNIREENGKNICDIDKSRLNLRQKILIESQKKAERFEYKFKSF